KTGGTERAGRAEWSVARVGMASFVCRVQFLDDTDPFSSTSFPEPARPPRFSFREDLPLSSQLRALHHLLRAPHRVSALTCSPLYLFMCLVACLFVCLLFLCKPRSNTLGTSRDQYTKLTVIN
uniref:FHOD1 N-terminal GTPase-binding domain-containing protein n=1 Tax=Astyanax mexicanus TaxID=7994 RepID=A0A8B9HMI1_ASTMX